MARRLKKSEYEALRQRKMKEIEKRVNHMVKDCSSYEDYNLNFLQRATSPPSSLLHATSRNNSVSFVSKSKHVLFYMMVIRFYSLQKEPQPLQFDKKLTEAVL